MTIRARFPHDTTDSVSRDQDIMRLEAVTLPDLGIGPLTPILVSHWFVERGAQVWEGDRLVEIAAGLVTFDVPAPCAGRLTRILAHEDDRVAAGAVLAWLSVGD